MKKKTSYFVRPESVKGNYIDTFIYHIQGGYDIKYVKRRQDNTKTCGLANPEMIEVVKMTPVFTTKERGQEKKNKL